MEASLVGKGYSWLDKLAIGHTSLGTIGSPTSTVHCIPAMMMVMICSQDNARDEVMPMCSDEWQVSHSFHTTSRPYHHL